MKNLIYGAILSGCVCLFVSCDEDTDSVNFAPQLEATAASNVTRTSVTMKGYINNDRQSSLEDFGFMYSTVPSLPEDATVRVRVTDMGDGNLVADVSGLSAGTTYYWCTYANSGVSVAKSEIKSFTSESTTAPTLGKFDDGKYLELLSVGENSCKVRGLLLDDGGKDNVAVGFCWYKKSASEKDAVKVSTVLNSDLRTFDCEIGNLEDGCEYCIYPYAQNGSSSGDMTEGEATVVTTVKYEKPVLSVSPLEFVSAGHVRAAALVRKGNHEIIEQGFCYSSETEKPVLGAHGKAEADMDAEGRISAEIVFENGSITYWVRAYAKDDKDSVNYSETVKFEPSDFYGLTKQGR